MPVARSQERVVVTGGCGFVGSHLVRTLAESRPSWRVAVHDRAGRGGLDVTDAPAVRAMVMSEAPTVVIHLAAISAVTASVQDPSQAWRVNFEGTLNLTKALSEAAPDCHLLYVSTAEVYGRSLQAGPVDECALLEPTNPYAASKAAADICVRQYAYSGLSATIARPFNHTGPGQSEAFVVPAFCAQIARIEQGLAPPVMHVGDLDDERDFLHVDDVVSAYLAMLDARGSFSPGSVFNVASGVPVRIGDLLETLLGLTPTRIEIRIDPARQRSGGTPRMIGNPYKLWAEARWRPGIPLIQTLCGVMDAERAKLADRPGLAG